MSTSEALRLYGTTEQPSAWQTISAGPLSVDLENGQLRYIRFGGVEVLRAISFLARDRYWGTFTATIDDLKVDEASGHFRISYSARCAPGEGDLNYWVEIEGDASGRLRFAASGAPGADFLTNRTGFVVLHPLEGVAGASVDVEHASGTVESINLPDLISPHEPVTDIFALTHRIEGLTVRVEMTGDAYDMEDQRNWTDASFKTYIRPLSKPRPYIMPAGELFEQSITVRITGSLAPTKAAEAAEVLTIGPKIGRLPGIAVTIEGKDAAQSLGHIPAGVSSIIGRPDSPSDLAAIAAVARQANAPLTLQFAIQGHDPAAELIPWVEAAGGIDIESVLVIPYRLYPLRPADIVPGAASLSEIARSARSAFPASRIGGGVMTGFTEFNRNRPPLDDVDFVTHATSAIVHAADDRSVIESLEALPYVFRSAKHLSGGKPYRLGPTTIGLGLNPDGPPRHADHRATMIRNDPRHSALFGAAWTLAYTKQLVTAGIDEFSPSHVIGDLGMLDDDCSPRPIAHLIAALAAHRGCDVYAVNGLPPGSVGFAVESQVWVSNLTPDPQPIALPRPGTISILEDDQGFQPMSGSGSDHLELPAFAVARIDISERHIGACDRTST